MKKILQLMSVALIGSLSFLSCQEIEEVYNQTPILSKPEVTNITATSARISDNGLYAASEVLVSTLPDMSEIVAEKGYESKYGHIANVYDLKANTTYYAQSIIVYRCSDYEEGFLVKSPIAEFKTKEYDPTKYTITIPEMPKDGNYGVFLVDENGDSDYEGIQGSGTLSPSTLVKGNSTVYVFSPYVSGLTSPTSVPVRSGEDFYYGSGTVDPANPKTTIPMKRFTVNVNIYITFQAAKEDVQDLTLLGVSLLNVEGNSPLHSRGTIDITTGKFNVSEEYGAEYIKSIRTSISNGASYENTFYGVLPVTFGDNTVRVLVTMDGDVKEKEVSLPIPASTWSEGSDVSVKMTAEYTADSVELSITGVEVMPWEEGSTGNIDVTK